MYQTSTQKQMTLFIQVIVVSENIGVLRGEGQGGLAPNP